jgi:hypothetical protein
MKELGNLAIVCARRPEVLMQVNDGMVAVYVGAGSGRAVLHSAWDDDADVRRVIHELNFGSYAQQEMAPSV